uniref:Uncharacterized protein n=1 Tax=Ciona savignyi TaxID=51511 RepID=H2YUL0_CIOSA
MQRYIGSQRPRYPSLPRRFGEHPFYTDMRDISSVPPDNYVLPEIPMDVMTMSDKCTELCKTYGHCDTCWMPSAGEPTDQMNHLPSDHAPPWQPKFSSRKDSGCSVDTTSSALSYYKMTRAEQRRRNDLLLPDVVAKSRGAVGSDANSLMSSTNSSGASSTRTNDFRNTSCNQKSQNHRVLKKSNSDTGYDTKSGPRKAIIPNSLSTQC